MNRELLTTIDQWIEAAEEKVAADTIEYIKIRSVREEPLPGAPFGAGPRKVLDVFLEKSRGDGFYTQDYGVGVVSAAMEEGMPDVGIWLHGDVVHEGAGWRFDPYGGTRYKGCIVGRGATDNKGQLAAIYHLFRIFRELQIPLKYNPAIYLGSNEESGMADLTGIPGNPDAKGFLNVCTPPRLSIVPDSSFPVGFGGKGSVTVTLRSKQALQGIVLTAGQPEDPGAALAVLDRTDVPDDLPGCTVKKGEKTEISAFSAPVHGAKPDPNGNMITFLSAALLGADLVAQEDRQIFQFLQTVSRDVDGHCLGIAFEHPVMGYPRVATTRIDSAQGHITVTIRIRYPVGITPDEIRQNIAKATDFAFTVESVISGTPAYLLDPEQEVVQRLTAIYNQVTGENAAPFTLQGGTYGHYLPNAYPYGFSGCLPPEDFPKGRGGTHGIDETVSLERLKRGMRIYARALLALNEIL